jgi:hypothetical protein
MGDFSISLFLRMKSLRYRQRNSAVNFCLLTFQTTAKKQSDFCFVGVIETGIDKAAVSAP